MSILVGKRDLTDSNPGLPSNLADHSPGFLPNRNWRIRIRRNQGYLRLVGVANFGFILKRRGVSKLNKKMTKRVKFYLSLAFCSRLISIGQFILLLCWNRGGLSRLLPFPKLVICLRLR